MSGHSKWATIKRKKAAVDARRSKIWTKVVKEIQVAARIGGGDPDANPRLRLALDKARAANLPKDSIKRALDKATGGAGADDFEEIAYEGYGPGGAAVLVECMTENRTRTVANLRHTFEKFGGHIGSVGSVAWQFKKHGLVHVLKADVDEDRLMEVALEAGAADVRDDGEVWTVDAPPAAYLAVQDALAAAQITVAHAELDMVPETRVALEGHKAEVMLKLIAELEDHDDVQNVYANHDVPEEMHG